MVRRVAELAVRTSCAGVDEIVHTVLAGALEQGTGAEDVGAMEISVVAPDADLGGGVENGLDPGARGADGLGVIERGADEADAAGLQIGCRGATEHGDTPATGEQALNEAATEKTRPTCDQGGGK